MINADFRMLSNRVDTLNGQVKSLSEQVKCLSKRVESTANQISSEIESEFIEQSKVDMEAVKIGIGANFVVSGLYCLSFEPLSNDTKIWGVYTGIVWYIFS